MAKKLIKLPNIIKTFGNSMYPLLLDGDILYLKKIQFKKIKVNDIITVKDSKHYFTHRVIYIGKNYLITKGDSNPQVDAKVYPKNIVGIVEKVKRGENIFHPEQIYLLQSTLYFQEIVKIKKILEKEKIEMVFLKGLPLHLYFEKTYPKRLYADCDILIRKNDYAKVRKLLTKFGYKQTDDNLSEKHKKIKSKESEISFIKKINGFHVVFDVHFEIVFMMTQLGELNMLYSQKAIDSLTNEFIIEKRIIRVQEEDFPILSKNHLAIYLCLHLFHHNFSGVYRFDFVNLILLKDKPDLKSIILIINKYQLENFIYPCFYLLNKYYKTPLVNNILKAIEPNNTSGFMRKDILGIDIFSPEDRVSEGIKRFKMIFFLSPYPIYKKVFVFFNKEVIYSIAWVFYNRLKILKSF